MFLYFSLPDRPGAEWRAPRQDRAPVGLSGGDDGAAQAVQGAGERVRRKAEERSYEEARAPGKTIISKGRKNVLMAPIKSNPPF